MEAFEERALSSSTLTSKLWLGYVDDTFVIWPHGQSSLDNFHTHLNEQHPSIQFTREEETDHRIPFLDVMVERRGDPIITSVHCKPTHTDRYLHYSSHLHGRQLLSAICSLHNRGHNVCTTSRRRDELSHLSKEFHSDGHPKPLVRHAISKTPPGGSGKEEEDDSDENEKPKSPPGRSEEEGNETETEKPKILCLPYIREVSEKIERGC